MTTTTGRPAAHHPSRALRIALAHTRLAVLEAVREPVVIVSTVAFPALVLLCFVVPQRTVAGDASAATAATGQVALFSIVSVCLFTYGAGIAEDRTRPFDTFLRSLPAGAVPQLVARIATGVVLSALGLLVVGLIAAFLTEATVPWGRLPLVGLTLLGCGVPFLVIGFAIGYGLRPKAALAVAQAVLFPLAFLGGLFVPPETFPSWLDTASQGTPTRAARDLVVATMTGSDVDATWLLVLLAWTLAGAAITGWAYRRDEGRRFR
ncbi:MAG: ABC transporter permease [Propionibacteriales bacterium]|nr:ABC transporter permease [Propionibacteriales bacterium]